MKVSLLIVFCLLAPLAKAQYYETKKVYVHSFAKLIQWPDEYRSGNFEIAVLGESPFFDQLTDMANKKKLADRVIKVIKIGAVNEIKKSHMLVLPVDQSALLADVLKKIGSGSTLVITEKEGLAAKGSDINFVEKNGKLVFEINQGTLSKHKLKAANELTRLAILL